AQPLLVFDQENGATAGQIGRRGMHLAGGGNRGRRSLQQLRRLDLIRAWNVARQEDAEDRALADLRFHIDESAGLLDDAIDRRKTEPGAFSHVLRRIEGVEDLIDDLRRNPAAGILDLDQHVVVRRHVLVPVLYVVDADVGRAQREFAAQRHGVARIDREIDDHLFELSDIGLGRPEIAHLRNVERHVLADQAPQQNGEIRERLAEVDHLRAQGLLARERQQLPHQARGAVGVLLDVYNVLEGRIGRPMRIQQKVGRHHDRAEQIVEIVRDVSRQTADSLHLLLLVDLVLERALLRGFERVDDRSFTIALLLVLDRGDEKVGIALAGTFERRLDRINFALSLCRRADSGFEDAPVALGDDGEDRAILPSFAFEYGV